MRLSYEAQVQNLMRRLKITEDEAKELVADDEKITYKNADNDLTPQQIKNRSHIMRKTEKTEVKSVEDLLWITKQRSRPDKACDVSLKIKKNGNLAISIKNTIVEKYAMKHICVATSGRRMYFRAANSNDGFALTKTSAYRYNTSMFAGTDLNRFAGQYEAIATEDPKIFYIDTKDKA